MEFNSNPSCIMHIDLNSCFATIEQQANPFLRGKPVAVAAFTSPGGCILAASIEAKRIGIKTGMRVKDGRAIYSKLVVLPPDPWKYRNVHLKLRKLISDYTNDFSPKSIDEFVLNLKDYPALKDCSIKLVAQDIKRRIKNTYQIIEFNKTCIVSVWRKRCLLSWPALPFHRSQYLCM